MSFRRHVHIHTVTRTYGQYLASRFNGVQGNHLDLCLGQRLSIYRITSEPYVAIREYFRWKWCAGDLRMGEEQLTVVKVCRRHHLHSAAAAAAVLARRYECYVGSFAYAHHLAVQCVWTTASVVGHCVLAPPGESNRSNWWYSSISTRLLMCRSATTFLRFVRRNNRPVQYNTMNHHQPVCY